MPSLKVTVDKALRLLDISALATVGSGDHLLTSDDEGFVERFRVFTLVFWPRVSPKSASGGKTVLGQGGFMQTKSTKATKQSTRKRTTTRKKTSALATCPVGGAGWCSFPFSASQLQKRMKSMTEQEQPEKELATAGDSRTKSR
jgi:hypothetical protein